ncbi:hypothetical protein JSO19_00130 [Leucobacter sp. UCMA 4100]|uniref:hypothetical protein n=1 Tax=Leucobacter sp. UCMA 4100 TaxID=2810534 RepID=UPI0022EB9829|nr:hypothetical protein [Leucobacter sp. UCMA 4100]MDA3145785.1 hypothetical protein [Leucobacter sp. UCMA 4100]
MKSPIYMYPMDAGEEQLAAILRDQYQGVSFTDEEIAALDAVVQLSHRIGGGREDSGADKKLTPATQYAFQRGWIAETVCGYEPTIAGRLTADELRDQAGFGRSFKPWEQAMQHEIDLPSNFLPDEWVPASYVLGWLRQYESQGCTNEVVVHDGYCYPLLALGTRMARYPGVRFATEAVAGYEREGLVTIREGGLYLTDAGLEKLNEFSRYEAEQIGDER